MCQSAVLMAPYNYLPFSIIVVPDFQMAEFVEQSYKWLCVDGFIGITVKVIYLSV